MASSLPPRQFTMVAGQDIDPLFLCPICQDSWADPVELVPCGDIFCQACVTAARATHAAQPMIMENFQCPQCHTVVQSEKKPNRMLLNTVLEVEVECRYCKWHGTREASSQHDCEEGKRQKALNTADTVAPVSPASTAAPTVDLQLSSSTAPAPSKAHAPRRISAASPPLPGGEAVSSPPGLRGPRRAVQEIEGAFTTIEDDPTSTTFRTRAAEAPSGVNVGGTGSSAGASYDYGFGNARSSANSGAGGNGGGGGGRNSLSGTLGDAAMSRDAVLTSPLHPALSSPPSSSNVAPVASASNPSIPTSASFNTEPWRRYRLSQVEYDQLVGIYMMYDGGSGRLNHQQLRDLCFCMNFVQREEDVTVIFRAMDSARKGYVTQDDFLQWLSTHRPDPSALFGLSQFEYTDAILQFRSVDPEFNGVIDANDFCAICLTNDYASTPEEAMRYFHMCDERHTGYVSLQQYLRMLKTIRSRRAENTEGPSRAPSQQQQAAMGRLMGSSPVGAQSPVVHTPLRTAGSSNSGHGGQHNSGGGGDNSFGSPTPQGSDYWSNDPTNAQGSQQGYRQPYQQQQQQQQTGMFDYYQPSGHQQQQQQQPQRFVTSLNSFPGDMQHQQQLQLQRQQAMQQQPYSQMGRSTVPAAPQGPAVPANASSQAGTQPRSRLHRPSARPQRDEECATM